MNYGCQSMVDEIKSILIKRPDKAFISQENLNNTWEDYNYIQVPNYKKALEEFSFFEKILKNNVEKIYYLPESSEVGLDSIYTHDSLKITKYGAIYFNTGKILRQKESYEVQKYLEAKKIKTLGRINSPGTIEGGDIVWLPNNRVAIGRGYRTNDEGIRQFKELTKEFINEYIIVPMPHGEGKEECLHLMSVISMVNDKLAVVYSKYMPIFFRELLLEEGIKLIEVDEEEYNYLGSNILALKPNVCVALEGNSKIINELKANGCKVYTYPGENLSYLGTGGPTCLTCPIWRD